MCLKRSEAKGKLEAAIQFFEARLSIYHLSNGSLKARMMKATGLTLATVEPQNLGHGAK